MPGGKGAARGECARGAAGPGQLSSAGCRSQRRTSALRHERVCVEDVVRRLGGEDERGDDEAVDVVVGQAERRPAHLRQAAQVDERDEEAHVVEAGVPADPQQVVVHRHARGLDRVERGWPGSAQIPVDARGVGRVSGRPSAEIRSTAV